MCVDKILLQIAEALKMYERVDKKKKSFNHIPCWNILKEEDKWKTQRIKLVEQEKEATQKKTKTTNKSRPRDEDVINNEEGTDLVEHETEGRKRSDGIKKAKEAARRGGGEACMDALDKMWVKKEAFEKEKEKVKEERYLASLELDKATLELQKRSVESQEKLAEAKLLKEENAIMFMDMSKLSPLQLEYVEVMQKKIVARRNEN